MRSMRCVHLLILGGIAMILSACASGTDKTEKPVEVIQPSETSSQDFKPWTPPKGSVDDADPFKRKEPLPPTPPLSEANPAPGSATYADMALAQTNGSVRIFSLDDPAPAASTAPIEASPVMAPLHPLDKSVMGGTLEKSSLDPSGGTSASAPLPASANRKTDLSTDSGITVYPLEEAAPFRQSETSSYPSGWVPPENDGSRSSAAPESTAWNGGNASVAKIYFRNGSADLTPLIQSLVEKLAADARNGKMITVEGHASRRTVTKDPVESRIINLKISMQRAMAVSQELIRKGIPAPSIKTTARGDTQAPHGIDQGMTEESAARRVEIFQE